MRYKKVSLVIFFIFSSIKPIELQISIAYDCDEGLYIKQFDIKPSVQNNTVSISEMALVTTAIISKCTFKQVEIVTKKDPERIKSLEKQYVYNMHNFSDIQAKNKKIEQKIDEEAKKRKQLENETNNNLTSAKKQLLLILKENNKAINNDNNA